MAPRDQSKDKRQGGTPRLQDTLRLSAAGTGMMLGDLEHRVLARLDSPVEPTALLSRDGADPLPGFGTRSRIRCLL